MATSLKVGQTLPLSIEFLDQNGQLMSPPPALDGPPTWANTTPGTATLTEAPDGMTASEVGNASGSDTVRVSLAHGGAQFSATLDVSVMGSGATLTSIGIVAGTPTP